MNTLELNKISSDLYNLMICLHKKIFNPEEIMRSCPIPPSHVKVLFLLAHNGSSSISEIAKNLEISKPNMTPIMDKLLAEGFIIRYNDPKDRRILRVEITDKAKNFLKDKENHIKVDLTKKISSLDLEDLNFLSKDIESITKIIMKLD